MPRGPGDTPTEVGEQDEELSGPLEPASDVATMDAESLESEPTPSRRDPAPAGPEPDDILGGRYRLIKRIGSGGMGDVFSAEHIELGKPMAVKVLAPALATKRGIKRFLREAQSASKLRHPNVIEITDFGKTESGLPFFVMELLEGEDLGQLLARSGRLEPERACAFAAQILAGLARAHQQGIVHRDLKPGNAFVLEPGTPEERVKLLDFGIAKLLTEEAPKSLTKTGAIIGTPHYMSPEQALGRAVDHRTDLYALGVMLYELIAGRLPFDAPTPMAILSHHITEPVTPVSQLPIDVKVEPWLDAAILKALRKSPDERYASAEEFAEVLRAKSAAVEVFAEPPSRRSWGVPISLGVGAALVGGLWWGMSGRTPDPPPPPDTTAVPIEALVAAPRRIEVPIPEAETPEVAADPVPTQEPPEQDAESEPAGAAPAEPRPRKLSDGEVRRVATAAAADCGLRGGMNDVTVRVQFSLDPGGKASDVRVSLPYGTGPIGRCVVQRIEAKAFRKARRGRTFDGELRLQSKD